MIPAYLEKLFGPNWRTSAAGIATTLVAIITALIALPPETWQNPKVWIPSSIAIALKTLGDLNKKDAAVSGNGTAANPTKIAQADGSNKVLPPVAASLILAALILPAAVLASCASKSSSSSPVTASSINKAATTALQSTGAYLASPTTQAALTAIINTSVDVASGQDVNAVVNGIDAGSLLVRSLQSTPSAASSTAIKSAATSGGAPAAVASKVAAAVTAVTSAGATPDRANELAAEQLDAAVAKLTTGAPGPVGEHYAPEGEPLIIRP